MNELVEIEIPQESALEVFSAKDTAAIQPYLDRIRKEIDAFVPNVKSESGRKKIKSFAYSIARTKTGLDAAGKTLADEAKLVPKKIDANRKHIKDTLEEWQAEVRQPLTDWEDAEEKRLSDHATEIERISGLASATDLGGVAHDAVALKLLLGLVKEVEVNPDTCQEFEEEYSGAKARAMSSLQTLLDDRVKHEAEQAELQELREAQAARDEADRKAAAEKEAEERAALAAAQAKRDAEEQAAEDARKAEEKAEEERVAALEREEGLRRQTEEAEKAMEEAKAASARAEARAAEDAKRAAEEATKKAERDAEERKQLEATVEAKRRADNDNRSRVHAMIISALVSEGISEKVANQVVALIYKGAVPRVSIDY